MFIVAALPLWAAEEESKVLIVNENVTNYGVQLGVNISDAAVSSGVSSSRSGFQFGVLGESPVTPGLLYLQPELSFVQRGAENALFGQNIKARLNYLEAGVLLKAKINIAESKPFLMAGPHMGYLLSASGDGTGLALSRSNFRSVDMGFDIGLGMGVAMTDRSEMLISARYSFSVIDADPSANEWKSDSFLVSLGYLF